MSDSTPFPLNSAHGPGTAPERSERLTCLDDHAHRQEPARDSQLQRAEARSALNRRGALAAASPMAGCLCHRRAMPGLTARSLATPQTAPDTAPVLPGTQIPGGMGVTGRFVKTRYDVTGTATVRIENGVGVVDLSPDVSISQQSGQFLYLNTTNNPTTGQPIHIGSRRGRSGARRFTFFVPAGVRYTWLVIWCDPFTAPSLRPAV